MAPRDDDFPEFRNPKDVYCYKVMSFRLRTPVSLIKEQCKGFFMICSKKCIMLNMIKFRVSKRYVDKAIKVTSSFNFMSILFKFIFNKHCINLCNSQSRNQSLKFIKYK